MKFIPFFIFAFYSLCLNCSEKNFPSSALNRVYDSTSKNIFYQKSDISISSDIATNILAYLFPVLSMQEITFNPEDSNTYFTYEALVTFKKLVHSVLLLNKAFYNAFQNYNLQSYFKKSVSLYQTCIYKDQKILGQIIIQSPAEYTINLTTHFLMKNDQEYRLWFEYSICFCKEGIIKNLIHTFFNVNTLYHGGISKYYDNCANKDIPEYIAHLENIRPCNDIENLELPCIWFDSPILPFLLNFMKSENYTWGLKQYGRGSNQTMYYVCHFLSGPFIKKINCNLIIHNPICYISLFGLQALLSQNKIKITDESTKIINNIMNAQPDTKNNITFKKKITKLLQSTKGKNEAYSFMESRMNKEVNFFKENAAKESLDIFNINLKTSLIQDLEKNEQMVKTDKEKIQDKKITKKDNFFLLLSL